MKRETGGNLRNLRGSVMNRGEDWGSTVSTISSAFTEDDNGWGEEDQGPVEMKYVPAQDPLQTEDVSRRGSVPQGVNTKVEVAEEDVNDELINRYLEAEWDEEDTGKKKSKKKGKRSSKAAKNRREDVEEPEVWKSGGGRKGGGGGMLKEGNKGQRLSAEEKRERDRERKRKMREQQRKMKEEAGGATVEVVGGRPKRSSAKLRVSSGNNVEDTDKQDGDWAPENDDEEEDEPEVKTKTVNKRKSSGAGLPGGDKNARRRVSNLTPEQAEKLRQQKRDYRLRIKMMREETAGLASETDGNISGDANASQIKVEVDGSSSKRASAFSGGGGGRRKKVSEMTEEEKELMRLKWREEARQRRAAASQTTPTTAISCKREKREVMDIEERRRRDRERRRRKRAAMTPEQRQEEYQKINISRIMKKATMTDEERELQRQEKYFKRQAKLAMMTEEEKQALREKNRKRVAQKNRYAQLLAQYGPEGMRERRLKAYREMDPMKKQQYLAYCRQYNRRKLEEIKKDPEKYAEVLKRREESRLRQKMGLVTIKRNRQRKPKTAEQLAKIQMWQVLAKKKRLENKLERWKRFVETGVSGDEVDPDVSRQTKEMRKEMGKARRQLRQSLKKCGASAEEIARRVEELKSTFVVLPSTRTYKPRIAKGQPVGPGDIARLQNEIRELGRVAEELQTSKKPVATVAPPKLRPQKMEPSPRKRGRPSTKNLLPPTPALQAQPSTSGGVITQQAPASRHLPPGFVAQAQQQCGMPYATGHYSTQPAFPFNFSVGTQEPSSSSLQHDLESISYQGQGSAAPGGYHQTNYESSTASSQHEDNYANSYYEDDHSSPVSPGGNYDSSGAGVGYPNQTPPQQQPFSSHHPWQSWTTSYAKTPRASGSRTRPREATSSKRGAHRPRSDGKETVRDAICPECGGLYARPSLQRHIDQAHNPNFDRANNRCAICGEHYTNCQKWFYHYLRVHKRAAKLLQVKPCVCEQCGNSFANIYSLRVHVDTMHGEALKPENQLKCSLCPESKKRFKTWTALAVHAKARHPGERIPIPATTGRPCFRCKEGFSNEKLLGEHVAKEHPESYFPCEYCNNCRFSQLGLNYHFLRCPKIGNAERKRKKEEWTGTLFSVETWETKCEYCENFVTLGCLKGHYKVCHNVEEESWLCQECNKEFRLRQAWVSHLEEKHGKSLEQLREFVFKLNCPEGKMEGFCKQSKTVLMGRNSKKNRERLGEAGLSRGMKRDRRLQALKEKGEGAETEPEVRPVRKPRPIQKRVTPGKRGRKVRVVCDEDEVEPEVEENSKRGTNMKEQVPEVEVDKDSVGEREKPELKSGSSSDESSSEESSEDDEDSFWSTGSE